MDLSIENGTLVALLGSNGTGKSTLLKCIAKLLTPTKGRVWIENLDITLKHESEIARLRSIVLSDRVYPFNMKVEELIALGRYPYTNPLSTFDAKDLQIIQDSAEMMGVRDLLDRKFSELSDGQKQKVLIARALAQEPRILILDEPATHLDAKSKVEILLKIRSLAKSKKIAIMASLHEIELAFRIADRVFVLDEGRIRTAGSPESILNEQEVSKIYPTSSAAWSPLFGTLELICDGNDNNMAPNGCAPHVYVVAGNGSGIPIFRILARNNVPFSSGILQENDVDYKLAKLMGANVDATSAFEPVQSEDVDRVIKKLTSVDPNSLLVIDAGVRIGTSNREIATLLKMLCDFNIRILSMRNNVDIIDLYGANTLVERTEMDGLRERLIISNMAGSLKQINSYSGGSY